MKLEFSTIAPVSKKNRSVIRRIGGRGRCRCCGQIVGGRTIIAPSNQAIEDERTIKRDAEEALRRAPAWQRSLTGLLYPTQDVAIVTAVNARAKRMHVTIEPIAEKPKGFTGRSRDLHSHIDVLCDALEGVTYTNDNQVAEHYWSRTLGED